MSIAPWLITIGDFQVDLFFTMSDSKRSSGLMETLMSERRMYERAIFSDVLIAPVPLDVRSTFKFGGARRNRTDDLLLAKQALSQLSYGPGQPKPAFAKWLRQATSQ